MKRLLKFIAWTGAGLLGLATIGAAALYVVIAKPYLSHREWRASTEPETIDVVYVLYACGDHSPRLYQIVSPEGDPVKWTDRPTILSLPEGVPSPEDTELAVSGNVFHLTGYRYRAEERNILTGTTRTRSASRFDLVSWRAQTPYSVWGPEGAEGTRQRVVRTEPVSHGATGDHKSADGFVTRHYVPC